MPTTDTSPRLTRAEWQSVATALRAMDERPRRGNPMLAVRLFAALTRRLRRPADIYRPSPARAGFNDRQIAALALLSV